MTNNKNSFRISLIQMEVTNNKNTNLNKAIKLIKKASEEKPDLIVLPENFYLMETKEEFFKQAETIEGKAMTTLKELAKDLKTYIVTGTMKMRFPNEEKLRNTCCVIDQNGEIQDIYHKIHSFNANYGGSEYRGSEVEKGGEEIVVTNIKGVPVGLSVCFDVRFPELYRILTLKGAKIILVPSIFMLYSGKDHWDTLLKARAIENQVYIAAPAVCGKFPPNNEWSYGRSLIVDPWGVVTNKASDFETILTSDLDLDWVDEVRNKIPSLSQRQPEVYKLANVNY